ILFAEETLKERHPFSLQKIYDNFILVLSNRRFHGSVTLMGIGFTIIIAYAAILPFIIQRVLGYNSKFYGITTIMIGISYLFGSLIYRKFVQHYEKNKILKVGTLSMLVISLSMFLAAFYFPTNISSLYIPIVFLTLCVGVIFPCCLSDCISLFPKQAGIASA